MNDGRDEEREVLRTELAVRPPYHFRATLQAHRLGGTDPTIRLTATTVTKALATPEGPVTVGGRWHAETHRLQIEVAGPGKRWLEPRLPSFFGLDDPADYAPSEPRAAALAQRARGLRLARAPIVFERHAATILQQRVTFEEAAKAWRIITLRRGEPAPLEPELRVPLSAEAWRRVASADLQRLGVDNKRWVALQEAARAAAKVEALAFDHAALRRLLMAIPGTGAWTAENVLGFGAADADAVLVGDVHLPHEVSLYFEGDPRGDDAHMLELLEPYRPNRFRILRWLMAPRYG